MRWAGDDGHDLLLAPLAASPEVEKKKLREMHLKHGKNVLRLGVSACCWVFVFVGSFCFCWVFVVCLGRIFKIAWVSAFLLGFLLFLFFGFNGLFGKNVKIAWVCCSFLGNVGSNELSLGASVFVFCFWFDFLFNNVKIGSLAACWVFAFWVFWRSYYY